MIGLFSSVLIIAVIMPATLQSKEMQSLEVLSEGINKFSIDFYEHLKGDEGNLICSPISAQIILSLAYHGARNVTAEEMAKVLHLPSDKEQILEGHKKLITDLQQSDVLKVATKSFLDKEFEINPDFQSLATTNYFSAVDRKDFVKDFEKARTEINTWVEEKTNNKIKELFPSGVIDASTRLVLVNAIHFKAKWEKPFNPELTHDAPFYITPAQTVNVPMMHLRDTKLKYANSPKLDAQIVEIPYTGNVFAMVVILPNKVDGLGELESKLATVNLSDELTKLYLTSVNLQMPKFKIEKTMDLNDVLISMGMKAAFSDSADFSGISSSEDLKISKVIQKAFVEVNEEGTEAAAATAMAGRMKRSLVSAEDVVCDRPFGFMIVHPLTGSVLFASRLVNIPASSSTQHQPHEEL